MKFFSQLFIFFIISNINVSGQVIQFNNGNWLEGKTFKATVWYSINGLFIKKYTGKIDTIIDLENKFCIPPYADAHCHNLASSWNYNDVETNYLKDGILYVQVLGNEGKGIPQIRKLQAKKQTLFVSYANALITSTHGHGFYPFEPLALGIYNTQLNTYLRNDSVIRKSRKNENNGYVLIDSVADVAKKWDSIMKYNPDFLKICLLDAKNYDSLKKANVPDSYGLSKEIAAAVVTMAKQKGIRVMAHIETVDDALFCAQIGVSGLAHMPGYSWEGNTYTASKYCINKKQLQQIAATKMYISPTLNINGRYTLNNKDSLIKRPFADSLAERKYKADFLRYCLQLKIPLGVGTDNFGLTSKDEMLAMINLNVLTPNEVLDIYCRQSAQIIFPNRKIGLIKNKYEANFLVLNNNPLINIADMHSVYALYRNGKKIYGN
jgi:hypothetical protein